MVPEVLDYLGLGIVDRGGEELGEGVSDSALNVLFPYSFESAAPAVYEEVDYMRGNVVEWDGLGFKVSCGDEGEIILVVRGRVAMEALCPSQ